MQNYDYQFTVTVISHVSVFFSLERFFNLDEKLNPMVLKDRRSAIKRQDHSY
jgi:hypothetical protein